MCQRIFFPNYVKIVVWRGRHKTQCAERETCSFNVAFFTRTFPIFMYFANKSMRTTRGRKYTGPKVKVKSNKKL